MVAFDLALIYIDKRLQATAGPGILSIEFVRINLLLVLCGHGGSVSPALATICASIKFAPITIRDPLCPLGSRRLGVAVRE